MAIFIIIYYVLHSNIYSIFSFYYYFDIGIALIYTKMTSIKQVCAIYLFEIVINVR